MNLVWPEKPTCHTINPVFRYSDQEIVWRPAEVHLGEKETRNFPYRSCSYCGSIHPEDLYNAITNHGTTLSGSDWKYGWPHKFYVEKFPSGISEGTNIVVGGRSYMKDNERVEEIIYGKASKYTHAKWYNDHLNDLQDKATFEMFCGLLLQHSNIQFLRESDGKLMYRAPRFGYQK